MRISDWSSDVCSSDLAQRAPAHRRIFLLRAALDIHIGQRLVAADVDGAEDHRPAARRVEHVAIEPLLTVARWQGRRHEELEFGSEQPDAARASTVAARNVCALPRIDHPLARTDTLYTPGPRAASRAGG